MASVKLPGLDLSRFTDVVKNIITPDKIISEQNRLIKLSQSRVGLFIVKQTNMWIDEAKNREIPSMLFSEFWYEGEVCFLFADTNTGKTALAVQIGESIARGQCIQSFEMQAKAQKVLYLDFELSDQVPLEI